ncbi:MAG: hypothetical protein AB7L90_18535 [Hyphomicrobiaceae bacterium]
MNTSIFLARLIGPISMVGGISLLLDPAATRAMARDVLQSPALIYLSGLLAITAGLAVLLNHNVWVADWRVLITIFGWLATIGGAARMALPQQVRTMGEAMVDNTTAMMAGGGIWLGIGAIFCFFGYIR